MYFIGAGSGDPQLLKLRGAELLRRADVVLYDYLANPQILQHAPQAESVCLGRHGASRIWKQEEINAKLVELAQQGQTVARLKGGDPAVFGRLSEEMAALNEHGIAFEIVPGVTAASAAAAYLATPLTDRRTASAVALVTGQENPEKPEDRLNYRHLADFPGTLVFYMGVTTAPRWTQALLESGKPPQTPALIVRRCTLPDQQTIRCRLDEVAEHLTPASRFRPPALVLVGPAMGEAPETAWFAKRPLFGQTVLLTRPAHQCEPAAGQLRELGAEVLLQPAIEISEPQDWRPVDAVLKRLGEFDWIVFSSTNGVQYFFGRLLQQGLDMRALGGIRLACVGPVTAESLKDYHVQADLIPKTQYNAEALAAALCEQNAAGRRFLLIRASRGREVLAETLTAAGGMVEQVVVYQSTDSPPADEAIAERLAAGGIDWVTATSPAIARSLHKMFGEALKQTKLASISPLTRCADCTYR